MGGDKKMWVPYFKELDNLAAAATRLVDGRHVDSRPLTDEGSAFESQNFNKVPELDNVSAESIKQGGQ